MQKKKGYRLLRAGLLSFGLSVCVSLSAEAGQASGPALEIEQWEQEFGSVQTEGIELSAETGQNEPEEALLRTVSEEEIDAYFDHTVLVGDSIMLGMRNYAARRADTYLGRIQFLAAGSFSVNHALRPIVGNNIQPLYQGQKRHVWESIAEMGAKRVFILLGMNDMNISGAEGTAQKYKELLERIRESAPEAELHVVSLTYTLAGKGVDRLNNEEIRRYNALLSQMAEENGWGFLDLASPLSDENGDLAPVYCSDNYVHQTNAAYEVWSQSLRNYAKHALEKLQAAQ